MLTWPPKDPDEVLDYEVDWYGSAADPGPLYAETDDIVSSTWILPAGITKQSDTNDLRTTTIWLTGGTAGQTYQITNRIVTVGGRTHDQTMKIKVKDK